MMDHYTKHQDQVLLYLMNIAYMERSNSNLVVTVRSIRKQICIQHCFWEENKRLVRNKNKCTKNNNNNSISDNKIKSNAEIFTN